MSRAIVIGAGIAGLSAAKVLSNHFDSVTVYDGGPQAQRHHLHVLLKKGQELLEELFPDSLQKLQSAQAPVIDWALDTLWMTDSGAFPRYESSVKNLSFSRTVVQDIMRAYVEALPNVHFASEVLKNPTSLKTDLVVIAAGSSYNVSDWIDQEDIVPINLTYRSVIFNKADLNLTGFQQYYYQLNPPHSSVGAVICPIENGQMIATIIEHQNEYVTRTTFEDFKNLAALIPDRTFLEIIGSAQPITKMSTFRKTESFKRSLKRSFMPKNTIVLGDTLTSLNPIFGQGMTISLMQAHYLEKALNQNLDLTTVQKEFEKIAHSAFVLSKLGSQQSGIGKSILNSFLKLCQKSQMTHHLFIRKLHNP